MGKYLPGLPGANVLYLFSCASSKAEHNLSSLSCMCMYVEKNQNPRPEMAYPLGIS